MNVIHEETQKFNILIGLLVVGSLILLIVVLAWQFWNNSFSQSPMFAQIIVFAVIVLDIFIIANFYQVKVTLTDQLLMFGFGLMKKKLNLADIEKIEVQKYVFYKYMGYGIRVARDKTIGYIANNGQGLYVQTKGKKNYFITSDNAEQLKSMVENAMNKTAGVSN